MSFSPDQRIGKTYSKKLLLKLSVNAENKASAPVAQHLEKLDEFGNEILTDEKEEKTKANLEPLNDQISTSTQMQTQLIQENSVPDSTKTGPRTHQTQPRHSPSCEVGTFETLLLRAIRSTGLPPDQHKCKHT